MKQKMKETKLKHQNSSNNKIALEEQIIIEKEQKFKCILNFVLNVITNLTANRNE